jgi:peroxiredoxin
MRTTYVLDSAGNVRKVFEGVTVDGHVDQVLQAVKEIQ